MSNTKTPAMLVDEVVGPWKSQYKEYDRLRTDLISLFGLIRTLVPKMMKISNAAKRMLQISGTIPTEYKSATYNTPIFIWIQDRYPFDPPTVQISLETPELAIPSNHPIVSASGNVNYSDLLVWNSQKTLEDLVISLCSAFSANPPLRRQAPPSQPPPNYFQTTSSVNVPKNPSPVAVNPYSSLQPNLAYPGYFSPPAVVTNPNVPPITNTTISNPSQSILKPSPPKVSTAKPDPPTFITSGQDSEDALILSIKSSLEQKYIKDRKAAEQSISEISSKHQALLNESTTLNRSIRETEDQKSVLETNVQLMEKELAQLKEWLAQNSKMADEMDFDKIAEPGDPYLRAALPLHARDCAIDDALYCLDKALQYKIIDLKSYLKATRDLATEQYFQRAMFQKILISAPPPTGRILSNLSK